MYVDKNGILRASLKGVHTFFTVTASAAHLIGGISGTKAPLNHRYHHKESPKDTTKSQLIQPPTHEVLFKA